MNLDELDEEISQRTEEKYGEKLDILDEQRALVENLAQQIRIDNVPNKEVWWALISMTIDCLNKHHKAVKMAKLGAYDESSALQRPIMDNFAYGLILVENPSRAGEYFQIQDGGSIFNRNTKQVLEKHGWGRAYGLYSLLSQKSHSEHAIRRVLDSEDLWDQNENPEFKAHNQFNENNACMWLNEAFTLLNMFVRNVIREATEFEELSDEVKDYEEKMQIFGETMSEDSVFGAGLKTLPSKEQMINKWK